jgi:hypothetical protein
MSISQVDTLQKAIKIAEDARAVRVRWGKHARFEYSEAQIADALIIVLGAYKQVTSQALGTLQAQCDETIAELKIQLAKANRQAGAANARAARQIKRAPDSNAGMTDDPAEVS